MGSMRRTLALLAAMVFFGTAGTGAESAAAAGLDLRSCPSGNLPLERTLPATAQPQVELDPATMAQPRGGRVRFIIRGWPTPVFQNSFTVCFRWRSAGGPNPNIMPSPVPVRIVSVNGQEITIAAVVPDLPSTHTRLSALLESLGLAGDSDPAASPRNHTMSNLAPIADVLLRIDDDAGNHLDAVVGIGVSSQSFAIAITVLLLSLALLFLWRLRVGGSGHLPPANIFLRRRAQRTTLSAWSGPMLWTADSKAPRRTPPT